MFDKKWDIKNLKIDKSISINDNILKTRNITNSEEFLNPNIKDMHDPFLFNDMEVAVNVIIEELQSLNKIMIYGDYDVDGITSTSILYRFFREFTPNIFYYIPHRIDEGYGLTVKSIAEIEKQDISLVITVDCGIKSNEAIELLRQKGIKVVVTDHHESAEVLPNANAIISTKRKDNNYPFNDLCGAGTALKLVQALCIRLGIMDRFLDFFDLAAIGTVADVVKLRGENRIIVSYGLKELQKTKIKGLRALFDIIGIDMNNEIDTYHIGYILGPRLNASGRMEHASLAVELLLEDDSEIYTKIALRLEELNKARQIEQYRIQTEVEEIIDNNEEYKNNCAIVVANKNWSHGIIGIVASKISTRYNKPTILFNIDDNKLIGSARSVGTFNIINAISSANEHLIRFGGHAFAAGATLDISEFENFKKVFLEYCNREINNSNLQAVIKVDLVVDNDYITFDRTKNLDLLKPFGETHKRPLFISKGVRFSNVKKIGKDKNHLLINGNAKSIIFNCKDSQFLIKENQKYDILFSPTINRYNNSESLQLIIYDLKFSKFNKRNIIASIILIEKYAQYSKESINEFLIDQLTKGGLINIANSIDNSFHISLDRADIAKIYKEIKNRKNLDLYTYESDTKKHKILLALEILREINIIKFKRKGFFSYENICITNEKNNLLNSKLFRMVSGEEIG